MAKPTKLYSLCSVLMAFLFAFSASVQLDDPDWYFWFPLYACACVVNMVNWVVSCSSRTQIRNIARMLLLLGILLFIKVVIEDFVNGTAGFWSLDLSKRVVREKTGSGLVVISLILQLEASLVPQAPMRKRKEFAKLVGYRMAILVGFGYGLPFVFFVVQKGEPKF
ncbi:uncharacterized protein LOC132186478 [Corylus avellana]|uniref:uncharacterized protein LOC132186478 n=1 Tax=Corylus avellana TaxID=13451 RepID=UPI00286A3378|nr:uncharacterized protein LOC132186478 [Corylus avellana]